MKNLFCRGFFYIEKTLTENLTHLETGEEEKVK